MDITKITDVKELGALAFDQLEALEVARQNLQVIHQRIVEVQNEPQDSAEDEKSDEQ